MIELKLIADTVPELHNIMREILNDSTQVEIIPSVNKHMKGLQDEGILPSTCVNTPTVGAGATTATEAMNSELGLDTANHPWDERIHSTAKTKNGDGTWKIVRRPKRFDANPLEWKVYIQDVLSELSGEPLADSTAIENTAPVIETENPEPQEDLNAAFGNGANVQTTQPVMTTSSAPVDLTGFLLYMTSNSDKISTDQIIMICQTHGVPELMMMYEPAYSNVVPVIYSEVEAIVNAHG